METVLQSPVFGNAPKTLINISSLPLPLPGDRKGDSEVDRVADRGTEGGLADWGNRRDWFPGAGG